MAVTTDKIVSMGSQPTFTVDDGSVGDKVLTTKGYVDTSLGIGGVTASAAEINKLTGMTSTKLELNLLDDLPASFTLTPAAGASNICEVTIQAKDAAGANMTRAVIFLVYLSDVSTGIGLASVSASGAVTAKAANGTDFGPITAKKALVAQTKVDGAFILSITDSSKTGYYVCAVPLRGGAPSVSAQLITGNYGT